MSLQSKYFGETADPQGAPLWWGTDEVPFRGAPPTMLQGDEIDEIPVVVDAKVAILTLPGDEKRYQEVIDRCANGAWILRHEKVDFDPTTGKYRVFLVWLEKYKQTPMSTAAWDAVEKYNEYRMHKDAMDTAKYQKQGYPTAMPVIPLLPRQPDQLMQETINEIVNEEGDERGPVGVSEYSD